MTRVGVLPYLYDADELCIVVVTSRDGDRWVLPKGRKKTGWSRRDMARLEAWEEAGVQGTFRPQRPIQVTIQRSQRLLAVRLYPMQVDELAQRWPEREDRQRRIVSIPEAQRLLTDRGMVRAVSKLMRRLS